MGSEVKGTSFRLQEDDIAKFKDYCSELGVNQAEMFQAMMNSFEMSKAKGLIKDRGKEIETFQDTINTLVSMFINSLAINQTSEDRIRETLSLELNTKDKTIASLQEEKEKLKKQTLENKESIKALEKENSQLQTIANKANNDLVEKSAVINNQQDQIKTLNEIIVEYKGYKEKNSELVQKVEETTERITDVLHRNTDLESQLKNVNDMKAFYEKEVTRLKEELNSSYAAQKESRTHYQNNIDILNKNHNAELDKLITSHESELKKMDSIHKSEISKLNSQHKSMLNLEKTQSQVVIDNLSKELSEMTKKYEALSESINKNK